MPYADSYRNDIFVSYAHVDNLPGLAPEPWISRFTHLLDTSLKQRLGCGEALRVYFDRRDLRTNDDLEEVLAEAEASAVFLAISSPSYVSRDWTMRELEAFLQRPGAASRLFVLDMLPLDDDAAYPPPLRAKARAKFWQTHGTESRAASTLDIELDRMLYGQRLLALADEMKHQLVELRRDPALAPLSETPGRTASDRPAFESRPDDRPEAGAAKVAATPQSHRAPPQRGTVLLAQATDELELEREQVLAYLEQLGIGVLPAHDYPQGGAEFVEAFRRDLDQADLIVQLLGRAVGRRPPDLADGYTRTQFELATESGKPTMLWHHPSIVAEEVSSPWLREALVSENVIVSGLEGFKADIGRRLKAIHAPKTTNVPSLVYVGADRSDIDVAQRLQRTLTARDIPVVIPTFEGSAEEIRRDLEENIAASDALVFVHGAAPINWVRGNLRRLHKLISLRESPPKAVAIVSTPPPEKGDIGMALPYLQTVDCFEDSDFGALLTLLDGEAP